MNQQTPWWFVPVAGLVVGTILFGVGVADSIAHNWTFDAVSMGFVGAGMAAWSGVVGYRLQVQLPLTSRRP